MRGHEVRFSQDSILIPAQRVPIRYQGSKPRAAGRWARVVVLTVVLALIRSTFAQPPRSLNDLTGPWQLFVDDYAVESRSGVTRVYHPFTKYPHNPVLVADRPWEGNHIYVYGTVLPNESGPGYRLWYHALSNDPDRQRNLYATSPDGIHWTKPDLGIINYSGSTNNNIIIRRGAGDHILSVIHTPWETDPARRYKLINFDVATGRFLGAWSPDGLHWTDAPANPILPPASDVGNFAWDPHHGRYNGYLKMGSYVRNLRRRSVGFTCSKEFNTSWPALQLILEPDDFDDRWATGLQRTHFYGLCAFPYESMYLGFLWIFRATDDEGYYDGVIFVELVTSHDGVHWQRQEGDRPPILPLGPAGSWDGGMVFTTQHPLVEGDTIKLWYGGTSGTHAYFTKERTSIGLATLRKDGFASLDAGDTPGIIITRRLLHTQGPLRLNYKAAAGGFVRVELVDDSGAALPGYSFADCQPLTGDSTDQVVAWAGQTQLPAHPPAFRLRFFVRRASLYSFAAGDGVQLIVPPTISVQPQSVVAAGGETVQFTVDAAGYEPLSYRWYKNGVALAESQTCTGVDTPTLVIANVGAADVAAYHCVVSNPAGATSSAVVTLTLQSADFWPLGILPGATASAIAGITADGSVIAGSSGNHPFIWSPTTGLKSLGLPAGATSGAAVGVALDAGGRLVVPVNTNASTFKARTWIGTLSGSGSWSTLPRSAGREWTARGIGANASDLWIVGSTLTGGDGGVSRDACRYVQSTGTTSTVLLPPGGHDHSDLHAASDTGHFAGQYQHGGAPPTGGARNAMACTAGNTACEALHTLVGPPTSSHEAVARTISRNGQVVAGWSNLEPDLSLYQPVIWNGSKEPMELPLPPGSVKGEVLALNEDGTLAGGRCLESDGTATAFLWDPDHGTRRLSSVLSDLYGLDLAGWSLTEVQAISADGLVLAGNGVHDGHDEGWVVRFDRYNQLPPFIQQSPTPYAARVGAAAVFTVVATGEGPLTYQWLKDDVPLTEGGHYAATTTATLTVFPVKTADLGQYRCRVENAAGQTLSDPAPLTINSVGDFDDDNDVDLEDFAHFQACFSGAGEPQLDPACDKARLDNDPDVDQNDCAIFRKCMTGPGIPLDLSCFDRN